MGDILFPTILTNISGRDTAADPISIDLEKHRIIHITGEITPVSAASVISQMRYLDGKSGDDIVLLINSPGGVVNAGLAIYDYMKQGVHCDVVTAAVGMAASMGAFLLSAGTKGKRFASANAEIMIHQPLGGVQGQASDIEIEAREIQKFKKELYTIISNHSHTPFEKVWADSDRNYWMNAEEAKEYGMIDEVLKRKK